MNQHAKREFSFSWSFNDLNILLLIQFCCMSWKALLKESSMAHLKGWLPAVVTSTLKMCSVNTCVAILQIPRLNVYVHVSGWRKHQLKDNQSSQEKFLRGHGQSAHPPALLECVCITIAVQKTFQRVFKPEHNAGLLTVWLHFLVKSEHNLHF